jgi:hypothetical protein
MSHFGKSLKEQLEAANALRALSTTTQSKTNVEELSVLAPVVDSIPITTGAGTVQMFVTEEERTQFIRNALALQRASVREKKSNWWVAMSTVAIAFSTAGAVAFATFKASRADAEAKAALQKL